MVSKQSPVISHGLVAFCDLTRYARNTHGLAADKAFRVIDEFAELVGDIVGKAGGRVVKLIGDEVLIYFPEPKVDEGVRAIRDCKSAVDSWMAEKGWDSRLMVKAHFGEIASGPLGTKEDKRFDVMGETVNTCALMRSNGIAISPEAFRQLRPETRKLFKKHTPPVTYIDIRETHRA
jgi:class 3 adenylate cyclase